jgi:hypothetical protein
MRGGADQDRRHDEQVQNETAVVPVRTSSFLTKPLSRHVGQSGGRWSGTGSDNLRGAVMSVYVGNEEGHRAYHGLISFLVGSPIPNADAIDGRVGVVHLSGPAGDR